MLAEITHRNSQVSIIGKDTPVIESPGWPIGGMDGDGIVSVDSQNLGRITGATKLHHIAIPISIPACSADFIQTHTCEPGDINVREEILNQFYQCHTLTSGSTIQQGFGVPWNVLDTTQLLLKASCTSSSVTADVAATYVYNQGYAFANNQWYQTTYTCTGGQIVQNAWCPQSAQGTLTNNSTWYVAYTCNWTGSAWKCGCRDQTCAQNLWQLQGIQP
jgi:hypothetical protein